jgi:glutaredoxin 3
MYCTAACPYCQMAIQLLERKGVTIDKVRVDEQPARRAEMAKLSGRTTVPQIFIGQTHVGGYTDLAQLEAAGQLDGLLAAPG